MDSFSLLCWASVSPDPAATIPAEDFSLENCEKNYFEKNFARIFALAFPISATTSAGFALRS